MRHSFHQLLHAVMEERGFDHPIWEFNDKLSNRELGELAGVRVPELLQGPCSLRRMTPPGRAAVIKPVNGCSARGVVPLVPDGDAYYNPRTNARMTWDDAVTQALADKHTPRNMRLLRIGHPDAMRPPWLLEEFVQGTGGGMPLDWKAYCFGGRVEVVLQCRRLPMGRLDVQWWDRDWQPLGDICPAKTYRLDETLPAPRDPNGMVDAFERVAALVDSPFIRVDLYESEQGPVFGETTPHPTGGTLRFAAEWDARLGAAWARAT